MKRSTGTRRAIASLSCSALAAGLAWLPAGPAAAAVQAQFGAVGSADTTSDCTLTDGDPDDSSVTTTPFSQGKKHRSIAFDATFTATGDPTDTVHASGHYSAGVHLSKNGPNFSKALLTGSGAVSLDASKGKNSVCEPEAQVLSEMLMEFSEGSKGWLYLTRSTVAKPGISEVIVQNSTGEAVVFEIFQGGSSHATSRAFVKPGGYQSIMGVGLTAGQVGILTKAAPQSSLSLVFHKAGSALTGTKGAGKSYVEFPGSVSCGSHKATLRWKPSASQVASGAFLVNGNKKASDSTPRGGEKIVLKHLTPKADIKITAKLQLKGGGSATASRSYVPCKG
jgi:hypothetical protein